MQSDLTMQAFAAAAAVQETRGETPPPPPEEEYLSQHIESYDTERSDVDLDTAFKHRYEGPKSTKWNYSHPWIRTLLDWLEVLIVGALMMAPAGLVHYMYKFPTYNVFWIKGEFVQEGNLCMEFTRWCIIFVVLYAAFVLLQWLCWILPLAIVALCRCLGLPISSFWKRRLVNAGQVEERVAVTVFIFMVVVVFRLLVYQEYADYRLLFVSMPAVIKDSLVHQQNVAAGARMQAVAYVGLVFAVMIALEQYFIQVLAHSFHRVAMEARIEASNKRMEVIAALYRPAMHRASHFATAKAAGAAAMPPETADGITEPSEKRARKVAKTIFRAHHSPDRLDLRPEDFRPYFALETYKEAFALMDLDRNGHITESQFVLAVEQAYVERDNTSWAVHVNNKVLTRIDQFMLGVVLLAAMLLSLWMVHREGYVMFASASLVLLTFGLLFKDSGKRIVDSLIFLFVEHPYDVGDNIVHGGQPCMVLEIGILRTKMRTRNGTVLYASNAQLALLTITNERRSRLVVDRVHVQFQRPVTMAQLNKIKEQLSTWLAAQYREYNGCCNVVPTTHEDGVTTVVIEAKHCVVEHGEYSIDVRRLKLFEKVEEVLETAHLDGTVVTKL